MYDVCDGDITIIAYVYMNQALVDIGPSIDRLDDFRINDDANMLLLLNRSIFIYGTVDR